MFWCMNRTGSPNLSLASLEAQGAKPLSFTSQRKISYKPNLLQALAVAVRTSGQNDGFANIGNTPVYDRWIATQGFLTNDPIPTTQTYTPEPNINNPVYYGHSYWVNQEGTNSVNIGSVTYHCVWEFKDPQDQITTTTPA